MSLDAVDDREQDVTRQADVEADIALRQPPLEIGILHRTDAVQHTPRAEELDRVSHAPRSRELARVWQRGEASLRRDGERVREQRRRVRRLVAIEPETDDA